MIVVDTETTGLDADKHSIVSIGAVEFKNPSNQFYEECRIEKDADIMPKALEVIGMTREEVTDKNKQTVASLLEHFVEWFRACDEQIVAGHNVGFDLDFLNTAVDRHISMDSAHGRRNFFHDRTVDTHSLTWMHVITHSEEAPTRDGHSKINSDFVFAYVGLDIERGAHNALEDAKLTAESISRLACGEKLLDEFSDFPIPWQ